MDRVECNNAARDPRQLWRSTYRRPTRRPYRRVTASASHAAPPIIRVKVLGTLMPASYASAKLALAAGLLLAATTTPLRHGIGGPRVLPATPATHRPHAAHGSA